MFWKLFVLILVVVIIVPIPIKVSVSFNILKLSGEVSIKLIKFLGYKIRVRFRGKYIYITHKSKTRREKFTNKNFNLALLMEVIKNVYLRLVLTKIYFASQTGYYNNAMVTAITSSLIDIVSKDVCCRILNNKKSAHIFVGNEPKYNEDCFSVKIEGDVKISIFDFLYSFINSLLSLKGVRYERSKAEYEQSE